MRKTMILFALAVAAALLAIPGVSSAQEIHFEGPTTFTGIGGGGSLTASGEPTITCGGPDSISGTISAGGTTGTITVDFTNCHTTVLGFTVKCHTTASAADNTITSGGSFHLITWKNSSGTSFPAILFTPNTTEIICASISNTHVEGNGVIATLLSPACGASSTEIELAFTSTASTQNHIAYTGVNYDLKAKTSGGSQLTAGLNSAATLRSNSGKLNCT